MKPLIVLLISFVVSLLVIRLTKGVYNYALSGRIAMAIMLLFTSVAHFAFTQGMAMMLPSFIPYKVVVIYLTGIIEMVAAIGLFVPSVRVLVAWLLVAFFILILPAKSMPPQSRSITKRHRMLALACSICGFGFRCRYYS